jgi:hypothetical protein
MKGDHLFKINHGIVQSSKFLGGPGFGPFADPLAGIPLPLESPEGRPGLFPPFKRATHNNNKKDPDRFSAFRLGGFPKKTKGKRFPFDLFSGNAGHPHNIQDILKTIDERE